MGCSRSLLSDESTTLQPFCTGMSALAVLRTFASPMDYVQVNSSCPVARRRFLITRDATLLPLPLHRSTAYCLKAVY